MRQKRLGISLVILIIIIVIILILASGVILIFSDNNPIGSANEAALRTDMQTMLDNYLTKYNEVIYKYYGDKSKITEEDLKDVIPDKYKDEYTATKDGVEYNGDNEEVKEIAKDMGIIVKDDTPSQDKNIDVITASTTNSITVDVTLDDNFKDPEDYNYYISDDGGLTWTPYPGGKEDSIVIGDLTHDSPYKIKVEVTDSAGNVIKSDVVDETTKELMVGELVLKKENANGENYTPGTWTNKDVFANVIESSVGKTTYEVTGTNNIPKNTSTSSILEEPGKSTVIVSTTDGTNTVSSESEVWIDNIAPEGDFDYVSTTNTITVNTKDVRDDLSGVDEYNYYIDGVLAGTNNTGSFTFNDVSTDKEHSIKVVIKDKAGNEKEIEKGISVALVPDGEGNI